MRELLHPWWGALFFCIGVAAVVGAFATMFLALGRRPRRFTLETVPGRLRPLPARAVGAAERAAAAAAARRSC